MKFTALRRRLQTIFENFFDFGNSRVRIQSNGRRNGPGMKQKSKTTDPDIGTPWAVSQRVAGRRGLNAHTVNSRISTAIRNGSIVATSIGGRLFVTVSDVERLLDARPVGPPTRQSKEG